MLSTTLVGLSIVLGIPGVNADSTMTYIYNAPESVLDKRYDYQWAILETALRKTVPTHGAYRMVKSEFMTESRQIDELVRASGRLTVMYLDTTPELEKKLVPIRIPVDRNLVGYRVLLIRKSDRQKFAAVKSLDDLRTFSFGQGLGWVDVNILRANKFRVVTGSNYDGLFDMLVHQRFDAFPRGADEITDEYESRKASMPALHIESDILIYYPLPMYFWFANTDEGRLMAARVEEGMRMMLDDGTYDNIFEEYQRENIDMLRLGQRRLFKLHNPLLVPETPLQDKRLWFDLKADAMREKHAQEN